MAPVKQPQVLACGLYRMGCGQARGGASLLRMAPRATVPTELTTGPFTLREARLAGLSRDQLRGASWRRVGRGLYVWSGLAETPALVLACVLRRLPSAVFSGRTAAWLHGLDLPPCDPVEVTI